MMWPIFSSFQTILRRIFYWTQIQSLQCVAFPCLSLSHSLRACCETWLMWPWHVKIHATSPKVTQPLLALPTTSFESHAADAGTKQKPCYCCCFLTLPFLAISDHFKKKILLIKFFWHHLLPYCTGGSGGRGDTRKWSYQFSCNFRQFREDFFCHQNFISLPHCLAFSVPESLRQWSRWICSHLICQSCYMDFSVKVVRCICQNR